MRLMSYNIEWFTEAFNTDNTMKTDPEAVAQLDAVADVIKLIDPDLIGVTEAPNTAASGTQDTAKCLQGFAKAKGLLVQSNNVGVCVDVGCDSFSQLPNRQPAAD